MSSCDGCHGISRTRLRLATADGSPLARRRDAGTRVGRATVHADKGREAMTARVTVDATGTRTRRSPPGCSSHPTAGLRERRPATGTATVGAGAPWGAVTPRGGRARPGARHGIVAGRRRGRPPPRRRPRAPRPERRVSAPTTCPGSPWSAAPATRSRRARTATPRPAWALRGGRGGLGAVTEVRLRLVERRTPLRGLILSRRRTSRPSCGRGSSGRLTWPPGHDERRHRPLPAARDGPEPLRRHLLTLRFAYPGAVAEGPRPRSAGATPGSSRRRGREPAVRIGGPAAADRLIDALGPGSRPRPTSTSQGPPRSAEYIASAWTPETFGGSRRSAGGTPRTAPSPSNQERASRD